MSPCVQNTRSLPATPRSARPGRLGWRAALLASTALLIADPVAAQTTEWTAGALTTDWYTSLNWTSGVPGAGVNANIDILVPGTPVISGGTAAVGSTLNVGLNASSQLTVQSAATLTTSATYIGAAATGIGTVTVQNGGTIWTNAGTLTVGDAGKGTINVLTGGVVNGGSTVIAARTGSTGTVTVDGTGGTNSQFNADFLSVGSVGTGTLNVQAGGVVIFGSFGGIGDGAGSHGTATVTGAGSKLNSNGALYVAYRGTGTLRVEAGGTVTNGTTYIGFQSGALGDATVTGSGSKLTAGTINVGTNATGTLQVAAGGRVESTTAIIADNSGGSQATVTGTDSRWVNSGALTVGRGGNGTLTIMDDGGVTSASAIIADRASSTSSATVTGTDSFWTITNTFTVGNAGKGTLLVEEGGQVNSGTGVIAASTGSVSQATVTGAGSLWANTGALTVGNGGNGTLTISAGGVVTSNSSTIAGSASSTSSVTVTGTDSRWTTSVNLTVGNAGNGTLLIEAGGRVSDINGIIASVPSTNSQVTVTGANSRWANSSSLFVGDGGNGTLTISAGGTVTAGGNSVIANATPSTSSATVTGTNSSWTSTGNLAVGNSGKGTLRIEAAGQVSSAIGTIAKNASSTSQATVTGADSRWTNTGAFFVGDAGNGTLTISDGGTVTAGGASTIANAATSTSSATVTGANSTWTSTGDLTVGSSGKGTLRIEAGGRVENAKGTIAVAPGNVSQVTVTGANSRWANSGSVVVGSSGNGTLTVSAGGTVTAGGTSTIGLLASSSSSATVTGTNSSWTTDNELIVGSSGAGTLLVEAGGRVSNTIGYIATNVGSVSQVVVTGTNARWANSTDVVVGSNGNGVLTVANGGTVTSGGTSTIGSAATSVSNANVSGTDSSWTSTGNMIVGSSGRGTLLVDGGGLVSNATGFIGWDGGSIGLAIVTGTNSRWTNTSTLSVGNLGAGTLLVGAGGKVTAVGRSYIGFGSGVAGSATVTGTDSSWTTSGDLIVGRLGNGTLSVEAAGLVSNAEGIVGSLAGGVGMATVTGANSRWANSGKLIVGDSGNGTLTVSDSGKVTVGGDSVLGNNTSSIGSVTVSGTGSTLTSSGGLGVGNAGDGSLRLTAGGKASSLVSYLGGSAGGTGSATVTGLGSSWATTYSLHVGSVGNGTLTIADAGAVTAGATSTIAYGADSVSSATVREAASWTISSGDLYVGHSGKGTLRIESAGQVSDVNGVVAWYTGSTGQATVTGAGSTWTNTTALTVGRAGNGTLTIADGGLVTVAAAAIVGDVAASTGSVTITGSPSALTVGTTLTVGNSGNGTVRVEAGGRLASTGVATIGQNTGSTGSVTVTGTDSSWAASGASLYIGYDGTGSMTIADGGTVASHYTALGYNAGSSGTVTLTGATSNWRVAGAMTDGLAIGRFGAGVLTVADGATLETRFAIIAEQSGSVSRATVTGTNSTFTSGAGMNVGYGGHGTLLIEAGGKVTSGSGIAGQLPDAQGDITVTGTGSRWENTSTLFIGHFGNGTLTIADGGAVAAGNIIVGNRTTAIGNATVTGPLSTFSSSGDFVVGSLGRGAVRVEAGGKVTVTGNSTIGQNGGANGEVTVTGAGSTWSANGPSLLIGVGATGALTVADGGVVTSAQTVLGWLEGVNGTATLSGTDSTWTVSGTVLGGLTVGRAGAGEVRVLDGARLASPITTLADQGGSIGRVTVSGTDSTWDVGNDLTVGHFGNGTVLIDTRGSGTVTGDTMIGGQAGSTGTVTVNGVGTGLNVGGRLDVGFEGTGSLTVEAGGTVTNAGVSEIGRHVDSNGRVTVTGAGSTWNANGSELLIGSAGNGRLIIADGGSVTSRGTALGAGVGTTGTAELSGKDTVWTLQSSGARDFSVGGAGTGEVTVSGGALLVTPFTEIGVMSGSTGRITLTGSGSTWTAANDVSIGRGGSGTLRVENGAGAAIARDVYMAFEPFSTGAAIVTGAGSSLGIGRNLVVGALGTASLTIADGGKVTAGSVRLGSGGATSGTLNIGAAAATTAVAAGTLDAPTVELGSGTGTIVFNHTSTVGAAFAAAIGGNGTINQLSGKTILTGTSTNTGATNVNGGILQVDGALGATTVTVASGARLGGRGTIAGPVTVANGGTIAPGSSPGVLTVGSLSLNSGSVLDFELGTVGGVNDRIDVTGALVLAGTLNITDVGGFGAGVYRLINYGGALTNNGLVFGTLPTGVTASDLTIQTSVANQVNLISTVGAVLQFWDGSASGNANNGVIDGGNGRWTATSNTWTTADGTVNGPMKPTPGFAIFQATPGTITVDISAGAVAVTGMQFAVDGYRIIGDQIVLKGPDGASIIRVGDGTTAGAGYTATIDSALEGSSRLVKTDLGTLVLTGINTYDGGTTISDGVLQIGNGGTTGSILGDVLNNATLRFARSDATTFGGAISGTGAAQVQSGDVTLTADNSYTGGTSIASGATLQLGNGGTTGSIVGDVTNNGLLRFQRSDTITFGGVISGAGAVDISSGTVIVTGSNNYSGGTSITFGATLQIGNGGTTGSITGDVVNEGTVAFARSDATLFDGVISGAGGVAVQSGTVGLTNTNTYTGGTSIAAGATLQIGNGGTTGSIEGNVANNGTLRFARSDATTFGYMISGTGGVAVQSGTVSLTNVNTYTGGTTINTGATLRFANLDSVVGGSIVGDVVNNGLMQFQRNGTLTLGGVISGTGALQVQTGTVALTGANTYTGGTSISNGATLQIGNGGTSGSITGNVANDGTLRFQRSDATTYGGVISGFGSVSVQSGSVTFTNYHSYRGGTTIASGATLQFGNGSTNGGVAGNIANSGTLIFNLSGEASNGSTLSGNGLVRQIGSGSMMLTGNSSAFTGTTRVESGVLIVEGRLGGTVNVLPGAQLQGTGTAGNVMLAGTIAPGNSIGTMNVGSITFQAGSIYQVEVNAAGRSDKIVATGTATLTGGSVQVLAGSGNYSPTTTYTILTAAGGRTGTFAGVTSNLAFLTPALAYDPTNVYLTLSRNDVTFGSIGGTFNQRQAGAGTESLGMGNPLWNAIVQLSAPMARAAFDQLSGEVHASTKTALYEDSRLVRDGALSRLRSAFGTSVATPSTAQVAAVDDAACSASTEMCQADPSSGIAAWAQGFGSWGYTSGNGNAAGLSRSTGGVLVGIDAAVFEVARIGLFGGYSHTNFNVADRQSSGGSDNVHLGAYGGAQWGPIGVRAGLAYTWHNLSTSRSVAFPGFADSLRATYGASTFQLFGEAGYRFDVGPATFEPFANIAWMSLSTKSFNETGGAAALTSTGLTNNVTTTTVGLRAGSAFVVSGVTGQARGTVGWQHAFTDTTPWANLQLTGGTPFTAAGVPIAQDAALLELGIDLRLSERASIGIGYTGQFAAGAQDQSVRGNFTFKF